MLFFTARVARSGDGLVCTGMSSISTTQHSETAGSPATVNRRRSWVLVPCGLLAGAIWGAVARVWMRWVSTDPEFSWGGTLMIVGAFTIFGSAAGATTATRRRGSRRAVLNAARFGAVVGTMPLFVGAGALMLPTVIGGGLAVWRRDWRPWLRLLFGLVAGVPVVVVVSALVSDFGVIGAIPRGLGLLVLYGVIVAVMWAALSPQDDGWRVPRALRAAGSAAAVLLLLVVAIGVVGLR